MKGITQGRIAVKRVNREYGRAKISENLKRRIDETSLKGIDRLMWRKLGN